MSMKDYEQAKNLIKIIDSDFIGPRHEEWIASAETKLGLRFPPTYRKFLLELGCGGVGSEEFYGIVDQDVLVGPVPNGIWLTLELRASANLSPTLIIVQARGDGTHYAIDTSLENRSNEESPVVLLDINCRPREVIAEDFGRFFLDRVLFVSDDGSQVA